jgi:hypothetical protein
MFRKERALSEKRSVGQLTTFELAPRNSCGSLSALSPPRNSHAFFERFKHPSLQIEIPQIIIHKAN